MSVDKKVLEAFEKLTDDEKLQVLKGLQKSEKKVNTHEHKYGLQRVRLGIISDTHIGSKDFNYPAWDECKKDMKKHRVEAVYHAGDVIEGMSNRDGHIYELETIGTSNQLEQAAKMLMDLDQKIYFTTGNHDEWSKNKANQGVEIGKLLEDKTTNCTFLGEYTANIDLGHGVIMRLTHEGATAYALSYSGQKRINALEGGTKPAIMINGHLHKMLYMNYRNIHFFEAGTLLNQTPFMAQKGSPAMVGYWILDIKFNAHGIKELNQIAFPKY